MGGKKTVVIDEEVAPLIQEAFRLAAEPGTSLRKALAEVTGLGLRSKHGKPLCSAALYKILANPLYFGTLRFKAELISAAQQPLVSAEHFDRVQRELAGRAKR